MFTTEVTPCAATYSIAASSAPSLAASEGSATALPMIDCALSLKMPVGSPLSLRMIVPPAMSRVAADTCAAAIAALFARAIWPSRRLMNTGLCGVTE